ncbi:glycosyltransferase [Aequorivita marina]|uniref:glycosyltransferase n=1 Tax=Aequorivita marina TaxID=3073654 RepID=UPI0028766F58|nr:glycosyltransferase [Aequorivita sp. S2608]MDS1299091.1 glycosyltransferase [Aequorivita sp. S2608]
MTKKNILFLINNLGSGGAEKVLVNLVNNIDKNKYKVTLRTLIDQGANKKLVSNSVTYESVYKKGFKGINYLHLLPKRYIYNKIVFGKFDIIVVYLHGVLTKIVANAPSSQKTIAYLHANMHNSPFIKSFKTKGKLQSCFKTYNAIVSVSKSVEDSFRAVSGIEEKLHIVYNTFDVEGIKAKAAEKIEQEYEHDGPIQLCAVGTLNKVKGFDRLINLLGRVKKEGDNFILNIIGDGPDRPLLQKLIEENNLKNNVFLLGFKSNPYNYISKSDLFVSASLTEGFSSVVVESVILGVPVLTTNTSGMTEILGNSNEFGLIVENNEEALYSGLKEMIQNKDLLNDYKQKVKNRSSFFSTQKTVKEVESLLDGI